MTETEFFYWLQGFFELTLLRDESVKLTLAQAECVKRHIALTRAALRRGQQLGERVARIEMAIDMLDDSPGLAERMTLRIRDEVNAQFQHVIDPQAGDAEQQATLNALHHGPGPDAIMRC